jgi:hypothetical protein
MSFPEAPLKGGVGSNRAFSLLIGAAGSKGSGLVQ